MNNLLRTVTAVAAVLLLAISCTQPLSTEEFIRANDLGEYAFELDMSDSLARYDLSFYTRVDKMRGNVVSFPISIELTSPSGQLYTDKVTFDYAASPRADYARSLQPVENGIWTLKVYTNEKGLRGMGLICKKNY